MDATETWAPVHAAASHEVSSLGRVRSLPRVFIRSNGWPVTVHGRILKPTLTPAGYLSLWICGKKKFVHVLVLEAFVGPRPEGLDACHWNGIRTDNRLENLRWDTRSANVKDALRHGTHPKGRRTHCPLGHPLVAPNLVRSYLPYRNCLACSRARANARWLKGKGECPDLIEIAGCHFEAIMADKVAA